MSAVRPDVIIDFIEGRLDDAMRQELQTRYSSDEAFRKDVENYRHVLDLLGEPEPDLPSELTRSLYGLYGRRRLPAHLRKAWAHLVEITSRVTLGDHRPLAMGTRDASVSGRHCILLEDVELDVHLETAGRKVELRGQIIELRESAEPLSDRGFALESESEVIEGRLDEMGEFRVVIAAQKQLDLWIGDESGQRLLRFSLSQLLATS